MLVDNYYTEHLQRIIPTTATAELQRWW